MDMKSDYMDYNVCVGMGWWVGGGMAEWIGGGHWRHGWTRSVKYAGCKWRHQRDAVGWDGERDDEKRKSVVV